MATCRFHACVYRSSFYTEYLTRCTDAADGTGLGFATRPHSVPLRSRDRISSLFDGLVAIPNKGENIYYGYFSGLKRSDKIMFCLSNASFETLECVGCIRFK